MEQTESLSFISPWLLLQVRIPAVSDGRTLAGLVEYLYQDTLPLEAITPQLHTAAVKCAMSKLVALCEHQFAEKLEQQMALWPGALRSSWARKDRGKR